MPPQIRRVHAGLSKRALNSVPQSALQPLTLREGEVLKWIVAGKRDGEIAAILGLSARTVEKHVQNILRKLGMETRTGASTWWHEQRLQRERSRTRNGQ